MARKATHDEAQGDLATLAGFPWGHGAARQARARQVVTEPGAQDGGAPCEVQAREVVTETGAQDRGDLAREVLAREVVTEQGAQDRGGPAREVQARQVVTEPGTQDRRAQTARSVWEGLELSRLRWGLGGGR